MKPVEHFCCECGQFACYGIDVAVLKGKEGTWYCGECVPDSFWIERRRPSSEAAAPRQEAEIIDMFEYASRQQE